MMQAGSLRHMVTIQTPANTESEKSGAVQKGWADLRDQAAEVKPIGAREVKQYAQQVENATLQVRMRYMPDIDGKCRLIHAGRTLSITGVVNVEERNRELLIFCNERKAANA